MDAASFIDVLKPYYRAFAERNEVNRLRLLRAAMSPDAEIWGPKRLFAGYEQISQKIAVFHQNWPDCRLVLDTGLNVFLNSARIGGAILGPDGRVLAQGEAVVELAPDGRIKRVMPFWDPFPPLPQSWPSELAGPPRQGRGAAA